MGDEEKQAPATLEISMENGNLKEEKTTSNDEPEIKYGGIKAMPFVIGRFTHNFIYIYIYIYIYDPILHDLYIYKTYIYIRAGNETFEKLGTVGSSTNLAVYLTTVFNMKSVKATTLLNVFNGTSNLAPLIGAYLSDTYFGRYWTLGFASVFSFLVILCLLTHLLQLFERFFFSLRCSIMK